MQLLCHSVKKDKVHFQLWPDHLDIASVVQINGRLEATYSIRINQPVQGHRKTRKEMLAPRTTKHVDSTVYRNSRSNWIARGNIDGIYVSGSVYDPLSSSKGLLGDRGMLERRLGEIVGPVYLTSPNLM